MPEENKKLNSGSVPDPKPLVTQVFEDPASRRNIVGLFELLYKIDRRINPQLYAVEDKNKGQNKEIKS